MSNELNGQDLIEAFWEAERLRCLDRCQEILKSLEILSSQQPTLEPWCKYLRGYLAFGMHRWAQAERILTDLLRTELKAALRGYASYALGRTFDVQGRWQEAITAFEQTLSIFTKLGQTVEQARAWKHMAITFHKGFTQGDFGSAVLQQAVAHCQSALDVLELMRDPPPEIIYLKGSIWNTLGLIHVSLDQLAEAIACYQQDLVICRALDDRHGMGLTYGNLGEVYQKRKNWPEALQSYQQALRIIREFDDRYEETEALANIAFLYQEMGDYDLALDSYSQAIQIIETLRAGISSEAARAGFFATIINTYANTMLLCLEAGRETQAFDYVERARSRTFLDILTARSPDLSRKMESSTMTLAEVQATLADDTLLLEYFTTGLLEARDKPAANSKRHRFPPAKTLILAVTRSQLQVVEVDLSPNDLRPRSLEDVVEQHFLQPQIRRTLYNKLIAPVEHLLPGKRRLYLAPHGPLHYIPFQALLSPDGDTLLREAGPQLIYAPSATLLCQQRPGPAQAPKSCLSVGYNSQGETRLNFAENEAKRIAGLTGGRAIVGPQPKKAELYRQAADYRLLHLACHGEFDPESALDSFLHLAPDEILTALDVLNHLHLQCELVTLSACESGLSLVRRGDELMGLMRAFMYAGTPALVSTLWRVEDKPTQILMEKFYQEICAGQDFAEALKQAQLYVKNLSEDGLTQPFAEPYYWAGFSLFGPHDM